jgi:hypothetical protein
MSEFQGDIAGVATTFAGVTSKATASRNLSRLKTAEGNIRAATDQIDLEESVARKQISRSLAQFQGSQAAARAFRGTGQAGTGFAVGDAATAAAADQVAIVEANAAAKEIAVTAANQVEFEDPVLAALQGGLQGLDIGTQIASALIGEAEVKSKQSARQLQSTGRVNVNAPPTFENTITQILEIPGLNIGEFLDLSGLGIEQQ